MIKAHRMQTKKGFYIYILTEIEKHHSIGVHFGIWPVKLRNATREIGFRITLDRLTFCFGYRLRELKQIIRDDIKVMDLNVEEITA